jgi:hypothetical protein
MDPLFDIVPFIVVSMEKEKVIVSFFYVLFIYSRRSIPKGLFFPLNLTRVTSTMISTP